MKQILVMMMGVAMVGCGKKEDGNTGVVNPNKPSPKAVVEEAIRWSLAKTNVQLTKADLEKVTRLHLADNQLTEMPKELEKLTQLKYLYIYDNQLTDLKGLEKLTQLEELFLDGNQLSDLKGLEKLTQLKVLNLKGNPDLTKAQIDELKKALPNCKIEGP